VDAGARGGAGDYNAFVVAELEAGRCPVAGDSQHRWTAAEPPEWLDTSDWDEAAWADYYDEAERTCTRCGITDD